MSDDALRASVSRAMRGLNHDLKNPLGAADGYLDLLLQGFRGELTEEQRQTLERVRALIASGISILEDVVAYMRAEIDEVRMHPSATELGALVRMTMQKHADRAAQANITLEFTGGEPIRLNTDAEAVAKILDRMLENALDHTPDGGRVDVHLMQQDGKAMVRVRDSGTGISAEERPRIFVPFERGQAPARPRQSAGIGIGLPLARGLAGRLGGEVVLEEPADGSGASFALVLPAS